MVIMVKQRASFTQALGEDDLTAAGAGPNLVRTPAGIEYVDDIIIADLAQALELTE